MIKNLTKSNKLRVGIIVGGTAEELNDAISMAHEIAKSLENSGKHVEIITFDDRFEKAIEFAQIDIAFIIDATFLGKMGSKNNLRIILENHNILYTASGIKAASITKNKSLSKKYFKKVGLLTPNYVNVNSGNIAEIDKVIVKNQVMSPYVIKPRDEGSGMDVLFVETRSKLINIANDLLKKHKNLIIEHYVNGVELTVPILEIENKTVPLAVIEIDKKVKVFSDDIKLLIQFSPQEVGEKVVKYHIPARINKKAYQKSLDSAVVAHNAVGCSGYSRIDMVMEKDSLDIYILEINSLPAISELGLFSKSVKLKGFSYNFLIENIIQNALNK